MRVTFCGVRGSTPAPGSEFSRYGGHTSSVAISHGHERPTLVLDAGTGIRRLTTLLGGAPFRGAVLLGHLHWDHTHGLPFCASLDHPGARVRLLLPATDEEPVELLARMMSPPHFPIRPDELRGSWTFEALTPGEHDIEGFRVVAGDIPHKGGRTYGYRVSDGRAAVAYLSDHWPLSLGRGRDGLGEYHDGALSLARGVDVLIHDAQYTAEELPARAGFGHSAIEYAVGLAQLAGCELRLFHHDPSRTDDELDAIAGRWRHHLPRVHVAREGDVLQLDGAAEGAIDDHGVA